MGQTCSPLLSLDSTESDQTLDTAEPGILTDIVMPTAIRSIAVIDARSTSLTITWPEVENATRYILSYRSVGSTTDDTTTTTNTNADFEILSSVLTQPQARKRNLSPSSRYLFRVAGVLNDDADDSLTATGPWTTHDVPFSTLSIEAEQNSMPAPTVIDAWSNLALLVSWTETVEGETSGYRLQMREDRGGARWTTIARSLTGTEVKKKNLHSPLGYRFRVRPNGGDEATSPYSPPSERAIARGLSPGVRSFFSPLDDRQNPTLLRNGTPSPVPLADALGGKEFVLLYASAHWCPPCRKFTPLLANWYRTNGDRVEVVFLSCDRDALGFEGYFATHPWMAVGFGDGGRERLIEAIRVSGIPQLSVMSGRTGRIIEKNAVGKDFDLDRWRLLDR